MEKRVMKQEDIRTYISYLGRWTLLAVAIGIPCGLVGALFDRGVEYATELRGEYSWLLFLLPPAGLLIVFLYKRMGTMGMGTDDVVVSAREGSHLSFFIVPSIFIGTVVTHLCGGSAGREGAALQIGGGIGNRIGRLFHMTEEDMKIVTMSGMAAVFSALFGTPITATVFVASFLNVGRVYTAMFFPGFLASMTAYGISRYFGMVPFGAEVNLPDLNPLLFVKVIPLSILGALVSVLFVKSMHLIGRFLKQVLPNEYLRVFTGGCLIVLLSLLIGSRDYNGAGMHIVFDALLSGEAVPYAFLLKILFTAITIESGYKGGEIVPSFFIGSTFGATLAPLLGINPGFGAAIGLITVFGGATNTLIAPIFLAMEAFGGGEAMVYFAMAAIISYMMSGYNGLYSEQRIRYSKVRARRVDIQTNQLYEEP